MDLNKYEIKTCWLVSTSQLKERKCVHEYSWPRKALTFAQNLVVNTNLTLSNDNESSIKGSVSMLLQAQHIKA